MVPNNGLFYDTSGENYYEYLDLLSKTVTGSTSKAQAAVDKINFILLNNTLTPILYLSGVKGQFKRYDNIMARIDGKDVSFGVLYFFVLFLVVTFCGEVMSLTLILIYILNIMILIFLLIRYRLMVMNSKT